MTRGGRVGELAALTGVLVAAPVPAYAHVGHCSAPEAATTFAVGVLVATVLFRPWRKPMNAALFARRLGLPVLLATALTVTGCGGKSGSSATARPTTPVRIAILTPTPNEETGPDITVSVRLIGGTAVSRTNGALSKTEGHVHVSLDGKGYAMAYTTSQDVHGLTPGQHSIQVEFVAIDHRPFAGTRPIAFVLFTVKA